MKHLFLPDAVTARYNTSLSPHRARSTARLLAPALLLAVFATASAEPTIEALKKGESPDGCGCNFQLPRKEWSLEDGTFLLWEFDQDAYMHVDGNVERLAVETVRTTHRRTDRASLGDTDEYRLSNTRVSVRLVTTATSVCPVPTKKDELLEACEAIGYDAVLTLRSPNGIKKLKVTGACGC